MSNRPFLVTLVGGLNFLLGLLVVIGAIVNFAIGTMNIHDMGLDAKTLADIEKLIQDTGMSWSALCTTAGVILLIPGLIDLTVGYGLLRGWRIMWWIGIVLNTIGFVSALLLVVSSASSSAWADVAYDLVLLIINGVILWYMTRPKVKEFFSI